MNKFSIIMVSYNKVRFIKKAIESVLNQTYQNFELLILDAMSNDGTLDVLEEYKNHPKIKLIIEKDRGMYHARNKGILLATGDIIGFLNTDDFYTKNALEKINDAFTATSSVDIVYGSMNIVDEEGLVIREYEHLYIQDENLRIKDDLYLPDQATFIKKENISFVGLYDLHYKIAGDWDFWQRCIVLGLNFKMIPSTISNFRHYADSLTFSDRYIYLRLKEKIRYHRKYNDCVFSKVIFQLYFNHYIKKPLKLLLGMKRFG